MANWRLGWGGPVAVVSAVLIGCADNPAKLRDLGHAELNYYKEAATEIDYAAVESDNVGQVMATEKPRAVGDRREDEIRDITLEEAIRIALENNPIVRMPANWWGRATPSSPPRTACLRFTIRRFKNRACSSAGGAWNPPCRSSTPPGRPP